MRYRLALDIGTASCGLLAVKLDSRGEPSDIAHHELFIFPEPLLPAQQGGVGKPKKAARREARLARRVIDRRARRLKRIAYLAALLGLDHKQIAADKGQRIHKLRATAASARIELDDLLRVLLKLAKRRGYRGGFKVRKEKDEGIVEPGISHLRQKMLETNCKTVGQYLANRFEHGETLRLKEAGFYTHRDMIECEFDAIWEEQAIHHPILREDRPDPLDDLKRPRPICDQFFDALFYQRPLKSVAPMVGNCSLEPSLPRAPLAQPAMQAFRIEKQLADLRWGMGRSARPLSGEQRDTIRDLLNDPGQITKEGKLTFNKIYKALETKGLRPDYPRSLNMERSSREDLTGNRTSRAMKELGLLEAWQALDVLTQLRVINFLADLGSPDQVDQPDWQLRFKRPPDAKVVDFINRMVETGKFDRLPNMGFDTGRSSYSIKTLERLTKTMREFGYDEHDAIGHCYPPIKAAGKLLPQLAPHATTGNVIVDVALRQVRRAVNNALAKLGEPPEEVIIELSRDMALGLKARGEIEKKIDKNQRQKKRAAQELANNGHQPTKTRILRYLLWEQQKNHCPYCDTTISLGDAMDGNVTHFEHILPRSLTRIGRQRNHLVIAHCACNHAKGDRTPFEAFHGTERWPFVERCARILEEGKQKAKARLLLLSEYEHEVLDDEAITDFSERQFAETSWIGKLAAQWLKSVCPRVSVSRGLLTAYLRRHWKLETVIPQARFDAGLPVLDTEGEKITLDDFNRFKPYWEGHTNGSHPRTDRKIDKRIDHRHHIIDALVIAQTSRGLYQRMARHYKELAERRATGEPVRMRLTVRPPLPDVRERALQLIREAEVRHKPDRHVGGAFFQKTAYSKALDKNGKSRLSIKVKLAELTDANGSLEKARKGISDIVSDHTRRAVSEEFERRIANGTTVKEALSRPILEPQFRTYIKRVTVYQRAGRGFADGESALPVKNCWYLSDGYAYVSIVVREGRITSAESISVIAAARKQPAIDSEQRFFRGDMLLNPADGITYVIHQILDDATVRAAPAIESDTWEAIRKRGGKAIQFGAKSLLGLTRVQG